MFGLTGVPSFVGRIDHRNLLESFAIYFPKDMSNSTQ